MYKNDYLVKELTNEEKAYLKQIVINKRRKYIRDNYKVLNNKNINIDDCKYIEGESVVDVVFRKCQDDINSAIMFENILLNPKLYDAVKTLSFEEKMVLFYLFFKEKSLDYVAKEIGKNPSTVWRIKNRSLEKIARNILGGNKNV